MCVLGSILPTFIHNKYLSSMRISRMRRTHEYSIRCSVFAFMSFFVCVKIKTAANRTQKYSIYLLKFIIAFRKPSGTFSVCTMQSLSIFLWNMTSVLHLNKNIYHKIRSKYLLNQNTYPKYNSIYIQYQSHLHFSCFIPSQNTFVSSVYLNLHFFTPEIV